MGHKTEFFYKIMPFFITVTSDVICSLLLEKGISIFKKEKYCWKRAFAIFCIANSLPFLLKKFL